jgi:hypothetical protein
MDGPRTFDTDSFAAFGDRGPETGEVIR